MYSTCGRTEHNDNINAAITAEERIQKINIKIICSTSGTKK